MTGRLTLYLLDWAAFPYIKWPIMLIRCRLSGCMYDECVRWIVVDFGCDVDQETRGRVLAHVSTRGDVDRFQTHLQELGSCGAEENGVEGGCG